MSRPHLSFLLLLLAVGFVGCDSGDSTSARPVTQIQLSPTLVELDEFETAQIIASPLYSSGEEATGKRVTWTSSSPGRFSVDAQGIVTALRFGDGTVTASVDGVSASALVRVAEVPAATLLLGGVATIPVGGTAPLQWSVLSATGQMLLGRSVAFVTSDESVLTVDVSGRITGVSEGTAEVTASIGDLSETREITVTPEHVGSLQILPSTIVLAQGATARLIVNPIGTTGTPLPGRPVAFLSGDPATASVNAAGVVTGNALGSTVIEVTSESVTATVAVQVIPGFPVTANVSLAGGGANAGVQILQTPSGGGASVPFCITGAAGSCSVAVPAGTSFSLSCVGCVTGTGGSAAVVSNLSGPVTVSFTSTDLVLFAETFDQGLLTRGWRGKRQETDNMSAEIVADPFNAANRVVRFADMVARGDAFSAPMAVEVGRTYRITFDFLGTSLPGVESDGYLGIADGWPGDHFWIATSDGNAENPLVLLVDDGAWHSYQVEVVISDLINVTDGLFQVTIEDGDGGEIRDAYFDNIRVVRVN